uniref:Uncharacterized protein n=1 Tax=Streptomyces longisporoflavus TaxID=28044 RepID=D7F1L2_9ACTN|nr:hypothetical protein [Streptomyces longisporoflavus]
MPRLNVRGADGPPVRTVRHPAPRLRRDRHGRQHDAAVRQPASFEPVQGTAPGPRRPGEEVRGERPSRRVEDEPGLLELQEAPRQRKPRLVDRLLGTEQQPVPGHARRGHQEFLHRDLLVGQGHRLQDAFGQRQRRLRVDTDRGHVRGAGHHGRAVARAVRDAADHTLRPQRRAALAGEDRPRRGAQPRQGLPRAVPRGGELATALRDGGLHQQRLLREERGLGKVSVRLGRLRLGGHDALDHLGTPASPRTGSGSICTGRPGSCARRPHSLG